MIVLEDICKTYHVGGLTTKALDHVSLQIQDESVIAIIGPSGSGKTTLLNVIGCMDSYEQGRYCFIEENQTPIEVSKLSDKKVADFRRDHISFVFQHFALLQHYTIYENIELPLRARGVPARERRQKIEQICEQLGIAELKKKYPNQTSGGQQQRCAIARALVASGDIILADEPTGALDSKTGMEIMKLLIMARDFGKTVIYVTHDQNLARMADRVIQIEDGKCKEITI